MDPEAKARQEAEEEAARKAAGDKKPEEFDAKKAIAGVEEKMDKILEKMERKPDDSFDPEKLLRELGREEDDTPSKKKGAEGEPKFDEMSPSQFAEYIIQGAVGAMRQEIRPVVDRVEVLRVRTEVKECQDKYADFMDHKDEIFKLAMSRQDLSLEEAYLQVTGKTTVAMRQEAEKKAKEEKEKEPEKKGPFLPGDRGGPSRQASTESPEDIKGAAELALRDVLGVEK